MLRTYRMALGLMPAGTKQRSGDFRTPEGDYQLTRRNPHSDYFLSIQVSYPNAEDLQRARRNRWEPGGSIMVHGWPNTCATRPSTTRQPTGPMVHRAVERRHGRILDADPDNMTIEIKP